VRVLLANLDYRSRSQHEHRKLLAACRKGNAEKGLSWLDRHLRDGSDKLVASLG
jgi:DNA-binding FadR family transcriptional regulator